MENMTVGDLLKATGGVLLCGDCEREVRCIRVDSREVEPGDLFVPIIGENVDGHRFIPQVMEAGAAAVFASEDVSLPSGAAKAEADGAENAGTSNGLACGMAVIRVEDTVKALQDVGRYARARLSLPLVGVTGSLGKTTTREMIGAALSARYRVFKTPGNHNSQIGVPMTISEIKKEDEFGVIELGMSMPGELTIIAKIAQIDMAVITNVGVTHIAQLGSRENIYREKLTIQDGLKDGGVLILNGDDDMLCHTKGKAGVKTVYFGTGENCDFRAEDIKLFERYSEFTAVHGKERQKIVIKAMGKHNVQNALSAIAVCVECGMSMEEAAKGLLTFEGFENRQQVYETGGLTIVDDSYNASPASVKAAIDVFQNLKKGSRHIAVLADMKELGEEVLTYHREVGEYAAAAGVDMVVTLGEACHALAEGVRSRSAIPVAEFTDRDALVKFLDENLKKGDCVLFKGGNSMKLFTVSAHYIKKAEE